MKRYIVPNVSLLKNGEERGIIDIVWEAFHITIPQLKHKIKILERRILELEDDEEMQNGFSVKAHTKKATKGD